MRLQEQGKPSGQKGPKKTLPRYRSLTQVLRRQLADGELTAGARLPSLRELANQFNVSTFTVRQALRALEKEGTLHCIHGLGSFVRPTIPRRRATHRITVAFATIEIEEAFTSRIARSIEQACQQRGWAMQLFNARGNLQVEAQNLARVAKLGANAAIILPIGGVENVEPLAQLKLSGFPIVQVDCCVPGLRTDVVQSDHKKGAYLATNHLLDRGHRRVLMVTCEPSFTSSLEDRVAGYEQALVDHDLEPLRGWRLRTDESINNRPGNEARPWISGYEAALPALRELQPPIAIFAGNAYWGWGVFEACRELQLQVPRDVSIVCCDDMEITRAFDPPLTSVAQRTDEIGRVAVELLERRLLGGSGAEPQRVLVDVDLVERGSVASCAQ